LLRIVAVSLAGLWAAAAAAQPTPSQSDRNCRDDNLVDRCAPEKQRAVRESFDVPPVEAFEAAGTTVRRAFYVDGYGRDMPVVTFSRPPGHAPRVTVNARVQDGAGELRVVELTAPLSNAVWEEALQRSRHFDRRLEAETPSTPRLCLHSWVVTVEAWGASPQGPRRAPRRSTEDTCEEGLTVAYGFELARLAVGSLPACDRLDPRRHRNDIGRLEACAALSGDTIAAAEVMNAYRASSAEGGWPFVVNSRASLDWNGETAAGWQAAKALLRAKGGRPWPHRFEGRTERLVRVTGQMTLGDPSRLEVAPFEQTWVKEIGLDAWAIERMTVGPFKPSP
jgi:hypothetical protein